jgi:hypothetical protein
VKQPPLLLALSLQWGQLSGHILVLLRTIAQKICLALSARGVLSSPTLDVDFSNMRPSSASMNSWYALPKNLKVFLQKQCIYVSTFDRSKGSTHIQVRETNGAIASES